MDVGAPAMHSGRVKIRVFIEVLLMLLLVHGVRSHANQNILNTTEPGQQLDSSAVELRRVGNDRVVVDNGIIQVTFSNPQGTIIGIKYNGIDNLLNSQIESGYWDIAWYEPEKDLQIDKIYGTQFNIISQTKEQVEISFSRKWTMSDRGKIAPLNVDKRYIIRSGVSGIYMYGVLERLQGWPDVDMDQIRIVFKLNQNKFNYMAVSDSRQRKMPSEADRDTNRSQPLDYKEAVLLTNPVEPLFKGEVDDKYMYSSENKDDNVHGWISPDPSVGFWIISPSDEFRCGGPTMQDLTLHVGPTILSMFTSTHYAGKDMRTDYRKGEPWKKLFGPIFLYLNSAPHKDNNVTLHLWTDAKRQMVEEVKSWPYAFVKSPDYPLSHQRGSVKGQLIVKDSYISKSDILAKFAYVGLAPRGDAGSWLTDVKGYQFWTKADTKGTFMIKNVREGNYSLFAWVPGFIGDYKYEHDVTITSGREVNLGALVYKPPRRGPTLWEIGEPDRTAGEFFIPDYYPNLVNKLFVHMENDKFRQYGLWDRYTDLYPHEDLVFTVGKSNYKKDWFYAQVTRRVGKDTYKGTTWRIVFNLKEVNKAKKYTLWIALASAMESELEVRINKVNSTEIFTTGLIGKDNAIARHGIHGLYRFYGVDVNGNLLTVGENSIYLTQPRSLRKFQGIMYDYIRFEGPPTS